MIDRLCGKTSKKTLEEIVVYSTTKETHQSLLQVIMEIRIKK